jgi:hypothetical protein
MYFELSRRSKEIVMRNSIRDLARLREQYGGVRWRKLQGIATVSRRGKKEDEDQTLFGLEIMKRQKTESRFVLCIRNEDCEDLEPRKIYQVLPDESSHDGLIPVIDDSGEDYLYPQDYFVPIELPRAAQKALLSAV